MTTSHGVPVDNKNAVQTVGPRGPMLMQDIIYMDEMAHFDRERIPERVVHAKGAGEYKTVESTIHACCSVTLKLLPILLTAAQHDYQFLACL